MHTTVAENPVIGNSEMAGRMREFDWASTPLGDLAGWSTELIAIVNAMLAAPLPTFIYWGPDFSVLYNDAAIPITDRKHPLCLGQPAREVWGEAWHIIGPEVEQVFLSGKAVRHEGVLVPLKKGGELSELYWNYAYSSLFEGRRIAGCLVVCQEVTEAYQRAQHLQAREAHLSAVAGELSQVMAATTDAIVCVNRNWEFTYINPSGIATYAVGRQLLGTKLWDEFPGAKYDGSPYVEHYERAMFQKTPGTFEAFYPEPLNIWIRLSVFPTEDGIVTFSRDITEEKRVAAALIQNEKLAAVGRLASSIAHEINNPLESVTNLLYIARGSEDMTQVREYLALADEELRRVAVIANQTLGFHKQSSHPRDVTCLDLFSSVLNMYQAKLRNAHIEVEKRKRANRPVKIYEGDIRQVLANVIGNAIDAMPQGGRLVVRSREATDPRSTARGLMLTVADTGVGIAPEKAAKIFDAFYTTKGIGGTGLGLWISADIMKRHGGTIRIRSRQTEGASGTVVTLFLPFANPVAASGDGSEAKTRVGGE